MENETEANEVNAETAQAAPTPGTVPPTNNNQATLIAAAIVIAGIIIAGAILLKDAGQPAPKVTPNGTGGEIAPAKVTEVDRMLGNTRAKITVILYEDFQCPFCGATTGFHAQDTPVMQYLLKRDPNWTAPVPELKKLALAGDVLLVYRDFAFLGEESIWAAEAARCANDQGKFWEYHDYLYSHQSGENEGAFEVAKLKSFAGILGLDQTSFDQCLDTHKYEQAVTDSSREGSGAGVSGTPKGFIIADGEVKATIDGAESWSEVGAKIDAAR